MSERLESTGCGRWRKGPWPFLGVWGAAFLLVAGLAPAWAACGPAGDEPGAAVISGGPAGQGEDEEKAKEEKEKTRKFTNDDLARYKKQGPAGKGDEPSAEEGETGPSGEGEQGLPPGDEGRSGAPAEGEEGEGTGDEEGAGEEVEGGITDLEGRGERYWRQRMSAAQQEVNAAQAEHSRLQTEMNRLRNDFFSRDDPAVRSQVDLRIQEHFRLLEQSEARIAAAETALSDLEEEARRTGALPGWLR